jgi:HK97 family phage major capsid protein
MRETQLWDGDGTGIFLKGISHEDYAIPFAKPANYDKVPNATDSDVLMAAILQVNNGDTSDTNKKGFNPSLAMVNPGTITNIQSVKKADGTYIIPPFMGANGLAIGGVRLIPNLDLDAGEFLVGDFSMAKAYMKRNMRISFHYENEDDVLKDLVLVMASMRLAGVKITASQKYAFVKGTFAAGKASIEEIVG